ncbi:MAG TPA: transporter substrate-binding domain-containing protein [Beijerinckiaceae bacterium]|jgi:polar amino acid transport system substrate-binding protein
MRRRFLAALCLVLAGLGARTGAAEEARTIRIATEGAFPPFNYLEGNEPQGFEVDLGNALCAAAKAACVFVVHEWDGMIKGLLRGEYDAIMASVGITERRRARIAFSKPYYRIPASFVARKDADLSAVTPAALAGKSIGTIAESDHARFLEERYPDAQVRTFASLEEADLDLIAERLDLVLGDKLAMTRFLDSREGACCRLVADAPFDPAFYHPGVGMGLRKEDLGLKALFDRALDAVIADGTYDRIRAKYFSFDIKAKSGS